MSVYGKNVMINSNIVFGTDFLNLDETKNCCKTFMAFIKFFEFICLYCIPHSHESPNYISRTIKSRMNYNKI